MERHFLLNLFLSHRNLIRLTVRPDFCHDSTLSSKSWRLVKNEFGGGSGHTFDLMPLDSNALIERSGEPLPYFTLFPNPGSSGVNLFFQNILDGRFATFFVHK